MQVPPAPLDGGTGHRMFCMDKSKLQEQNIATPDDLLADIIVSPDTRRAERLPPSQSRTKKWPVLDASGPPAIGLDRWTFRLFGRVGYDVSWNWEEFRQLPRVKVFADFHCVTRW